LAQKVATTEPSNSSNQAIDLNAAELENDDGNTPNKEEQCWGALSCRLPQLAAIQIFI